MREVAGRAARAAGGGGSLLAGLFMSYDRTRDGTHVCGVWLSVTTYPIPVTRADPIPYYRVGELENQIHLARCLKLKPFWDGIFDFLHKIGTPRPKDRLYAIIFNCWDADNTAFTGPPARSMRTTTTRIQRGRELGMCGSAPQPRASEARVASV